jgi:hypothetical protein
MVGVPARRCARHERFGDGLIRAQGRRIILDFSLSSPTPIWENIVMNNRDLRLIVVARQDGSTRELSTLARIKLLLGALCLAALTAGIFLFTLIVGSLIALALLTVFLLLILCLIVKTVAWRARL